MVGAIDPAAHNRAQTDGQKLINIYREHGLKVIPANNSINTGIASAWEGLSTGKIKVFRHCHGFFKEQMVYRMENGQIKKKDDHLMDAFRYGFLTRNIAQRKPTGVTGAGGSYAMRTPF